MADRRKRKRAVNEMKAAREKADDLLDKQVVAPARKTFERETGGIMLELSRFFRGKTRKEVRPPFIAGAIHLMRMRLPAAGRGLIQVLTGMTGETLAEGLKTTSTIIGRVRQAESALDDIAVVGKLIASRTDQLNALRRRSGEVLASNMQANVIKRLQKVPLEGSKVSDLIATVGEGLDGEWWQVERTVRTETSFAYNQAQMDGVRHLAGQPEFQGKLYSRWTELIDDLSGRPFDDRVAADSKALHGQIALPGRTFTMPTGADVPSKMIGRSWSHPPNRPNDRAVLTPWMKDWDIPAYLMLNGKRTPL